MRILYLLLLPLLFSCDAADETGDGVQLASEASEFVVRHNFYRSEVGVADIQWSDDLAKSAQEWANQLAADGCAFAHSSSSYGENLWKGTAGAFSIQDVVDSWGSEKESYDYDTNSCSAVCGHYTQIVWEDTQYVGCAKVTCDGFDTWVCQYDPPGNYIGEKPY